MSLFKTVKFSEIEIGEHFECYGDIHMNYDFPIIIECVKIKDDLAEEVNGISFYMDESDEVFILNITT